MNNKDISVVVQGQIYGAPNDKDENKYTKRVCDSIRQVLPEAELILSTWEYCNVDDLQYDTLIKISKSEDPGSVFENFNRQRMTTLKGIEAASNKYILKLRSETMLESRRFINVYEKCMNYKYGDYHFINNRIVVDGINPGWSGCMFHMSDHLFFGLKEDVNALWDIPEVLDGMFWGSGNAEHVTINPHRYLPLAFFNKYTTEIEFTKPKDINDYNLCLWRKMMVDNFISLFPYEFGTFSLKYHQNIDRKLSIPRLMENYTFNQWENLYYKYCCNTMKRNPVNFYEFITDCVVGPYKWSKLKTKLGNL